MSVPSVAPRIDYSFDAAFADRLARFETYNKHHYRPNTYLHKWWGRRCGSTFRLILKGLVDDPERTGYYAPGGLEGKVILDPMMGGGTTLHEALRLGASVMGLDIDPIPILQARATLAGGDIGSLERGFEAFFDGLSERLGRQFTTHCPICDDLVPFWYALHGSRRRCGCREVLMVDSLTLRHQMDGPTLTLCVTCGELHFEGEHDCVQTGVRIVEKRQATCASCGQAYEECCDLPFYARYDLLVVAGRCGEHGLFHRTPDWRDRARLSEANERRPFLPFSVEEFRVDGGDKSNQLLRRHIPSYLDLFSSRQLAFLSEVARLLPDDDPTLRLNLALLVSTSLEFNSMLCGYKGEARRRSGAVRHTFSHHGYAFPYTALETNPLYPHRASGTLQKLFHGRIRRARRWAAEPMERDLDAHPARFIAITGERDCGQEVASAVELTGRRQGFFLHQGSATAIPAASASVDAVVTDPPYYDSIQYSDLAAFFRVWLRQFLPHAAEWRYDETTAAVSSERVDDARYHQMMSGIFQECRRVLRPHTGRLVFTFHHWRPQAWAALTLALRQSGFQLLNRYVVHAENPMSVHISNVRALTHDAILVLAAGKRLEWSRPDVIRGDSYGFTEDCATLLGWMLNQSELLPVAIERDWQETLATCTETKRP